jgi:hypothetical protein
MSVNRSAAYSRKQLRSAYGNLMPEIHVLSSFGPQHAILLEKTFLPRCCYMNAGTFTKTIRVFHNNMTAG